MNELRSLKNLLQPPVVRAEVALCALSSPWLLGHSWAMGCWLCSWSLNRLDMGVAVCSPTYFSPCTGAGSTQGPSPQLCSRDIFGLVTLCTLFILPLPQVFPDKGRVGKFCSKLSSSKNLTRLSWWGFSLVWALHNYAENWKTMYPYAEFNSGLHFLTYVQPPDRWSLTTPANSQKCPY